MVLVGWLPGEGPVRDLGGGHALGRHLLCGLAEGQRLGLGEEVGHEQVVVGPDPVCRAAGSR